jgi:hypothetical protein
MKAELAARNDKPMGTGICQLGPGVWCDGSRLRMRPAPN